MTAVPRLSTFVGRQAELASFADALKTRPRLVGLWGAFGVGKSRLVAEACRRLAAATDGWRGALVVELAGHAAIDAAVVPLDCASAPSVVVLDGADAQLDALASLVPTWTERAPTTTFVVTSRERCRLDGALELELGALAVDEAGDDAPPGPAVELFLDRARALGRPGPSPTRAAVATLVARLEGVPLLVERAAALLPTVGGTRLAELCERPLELLAAAPRSRGSAPASTLVADLRAAIARLPRRLAAALRALCRFEGAFTVADAAAVLGVSDSAGAELVAALRDRALLRASDPAGEVPRQRPWAWARALARDAAEARGTTGRRARDAVATRVLEAAGADARTFEASGSRAALDGLVHRRADLVALAERALAPRRPARAEVERAAEALALLDPLLLTYGPRTVDRALLDRAVAAAESAAVEPTLRARLLAARSRSRALTDGARAAVSDLERAVALARGAGADEARRWVSPLLVDLGVLHHRERELETAAALYAAALEASAGGDARTEARAIANLAAIAHDRGRLDDAAPGYERAIAIAAAAGDTRLEAIFSANLAIVEQERGAMRSAQRRYERGVELLERIPDRRLCAITLGNLGMLHHEDGRLGAAQRCHERALAELGYVGEAHSIALAHARLAAVLASEDRVEEARVEVERGARTASRGGGEIAHAALEVATAYLDVALARRAVAERRDGELATRLSRARRRADDARAVRAHAGGTLVETSDDLRTMLRILDRSLDASSGGLLLPAGEGLLVAPEARWFRPPGDAWHDLRPRTAARRILERLCAHQVEAPGRALGLEALREAGWPGERILPKAAKNRVYVVLNQLRELGLRRWIRRTGGGWALDPMLEVHRVAVEPVGEPARPTSERTAANAGRQGEAGGPTAGSSD